MRSALDDYSGESYDILEVGVDHIPLLTPRAVAASVAKRTENEIQEDINTRFKQIRGRATTFPSDLFKKIYVRYPWYDIRDQWDRLHREHEPPSLHDSMAEYIGLKIRESSFADKILDISYNSTSGDQ